MSVYDDPTFGRLPKNFGETRDGYCFGIDHVRQDAARTHRWKLVDVANQKETSP